VDAPELVSRDSASDAGGNFSLDALREAEDALERARNEHARTKEWVEAAREFQADALDGIELRRAREDLAALDVRVIELEAAVIRAQAPGVSQANGGRVTLGSRVTIMAADDPETFVLVSVAEADPLRGRISDQSPLGRALIGRQAGDEIHWFAPSGPQRARIVVVE
jgi:transcription elongation factor GreA